MGSGVEIWFQEELAPIFKEYLMPKKDLFLFHRCCCQIAVIILFKQGFSNRDGWCKAAFKAAFKCVKHGQHRLGAAGGPWLSQGQAMTLTCDRAAPA